MLAAMSSFTPAAPAPTVARAPAPKSDGEREERVRMTRLRQTIAHRLKEAQNTAAMLTTFNDVDMSEIIAMRSNYKESFEKKHGVKLGFMGFFVKACIAALKDIPAVNAEVDDQDLVYKNYYHIGVAVGTERGLVVPVVRDADQLSIAEIEKTIADFGKRAREGQTIHRRDAGRHVHDFERRHLRLAAFDSNPECPAIRNPRHASDRGASGGREGTGRDQADDVSRA